MKYCPYCGADVSVSFFSFCPECGKKLTNEGSEKKKQKRKFRQNEKPDIEEQIEKKESSSDEQPEESAIDDYDGYYDDVLPSDNGEISQTLDKNLIKKIILLLAGVLFIIGICVAVMLLL